MLRNLNNVIGHKILAQDRELLGEIKDVYFDDQHWAVRYLVVDTGSWLSTREVLVSPYALTGINWDKNYISTNMTKNQIEQSPEVKQDKPISRLLEEKYSRFHGWPLYWTAGAGIWPDNLYPPEFIYQGVSPEMMNDSSLNNQNRVNDREIEISHLRSYKEVKGYKILANGGDRMGEIEDMLLEEGSYIIRAVVIDTKSYFAVNSVLISPQWMEEVDWAKNEISCKLTKEEILSAPGYDPSIEGWVPGIEKEIEKNRDAGLL